MDRHRRDVVALIPAAGFATRLGPLPCSKEILPLEVVEKASGDLRMRSLCEPMLEHLAAAGIRRGYFILRPGKWDIPAYLDGLDLDLELAYLTIADSPSVAHTLDRAHAFVRSSRVALGFPDILLRPETSFDSVLEHQEETMADLVLGLFPTREPWKADMVELDDSGLVRRLVIKQRECDLRLTWAIAVWTPYFTDYLHRHVGAWREGERELWVGDVIQAAIEEGLEVQTVAFPDGDATDLGTLDALGRALRGG